MSEQRGKGRGRGKKVVQQPPGPPRPTSVEPSTSSVTGTVPRTFADASVSNIQYYLQNKSHIKLTVLKRLAR